MYTTQKGRGAGSNRSGRYEQWNRTVAVDDMPDDGLVPKLKTTVEVDTSRSAISRNSSPDLPFDRSINMYRGCEHGCVYCYARPSHTYLGYSAGLDFETKLVMKPDVAQRLREEINKPSYQCQAIALGANTDPYQPIERKFELTRGILEVLREHSHPVTITTKSASVVSDLDLLSVMAERNLVNVNVSVTTLDSKLSRTMEPRASAPHSRIRAISELSKSGIPVTIFVAPVIPGLNEHEIESILEVCAQAGARRAEWTMIRLPLEVRELFQEWLENNYPTKSARVMSLIRQVRGGRENSSDFFERMRGTGLVADLIHKRFMSALRKYDLDREPVELDVTQFRKENSGGVQLSLF